MSWDGMDTPTRVVSSNPMEWLDSLKGRGQLGVLLPWSLAIRGRVDWGRPECGEAKENQQKGSSLF